MRREGRYRAQGESERQAPGNAPREVYRIIRNSASSPLARVTKEEAIKARNTIIKALKSKRNLQSH